MKEQLISFETAKLAKEKGYPQNEFNKVYWEGEQEDTPFSKALYYKKLIEDGNLEQETLTQMKIYVAPTQSLLQKWLREVYNIDIVIHHINDDKFESFIYKNIKHKKICYGVTYEEVLEKGLHEALKLI